jgi:hypothetical protein
VTATQLRAVAEASTLALAERERWDTDVGVSDVLPLAGIDAGHAINHPGNTVLAELTRRILTVAGARGRVELPDEPLLGSDYVPLDQRVLDARDLAGDARETWSFHGEALEANWVHRTQMLWYADKPDYLQLAVERHGYTMEALGLASGADR